MLPVVCNTHQFLQRKYPFATLPCNWWILDIILSLIFQRMNLISEILLIAVTPLRAKKGIAVHEKPESYTQLWKNNTSDWWEIINIQLTLSYIDTNIWHMNIQSIIYYVYNQLHIHTSNIYKLAHRQLCGNNNESTPIVKTIYQRFSDRFNF